ncbi:Chemotaxis response regulator protein-glutamate methylesterase of group 1 operon [Saliniradius amylolyticus]|uniref:Chemotaxis response regulator protein-glutamate methylesterase of group 1 operon n=1 Tax=Saliniradius amylolyticus TaxID=2183582 RepID=A0A2S2E3H2_9ALTE|nr:LytTR family DNA-binding domain-containing protein [Saliniradius amylolyticus]AWL12062.1 Chemotaxis response regulator protein-glutamate methylesterase of group 1 operon [Saliniradius amylolyticus]
MANSIKTLIVDDEPLARRGLAVRLSDFDDIELVAECQNGHQAIEAIHKYRPDLMFLDIQMPGLNGFQVLQSLQSVQGKLPLVVFVTAYDSYAIKAFEVHALDYLLKPIEEGRLQAAVDKVRQRMSELGESHHTQRLAELVAEMTGDDCEAILHRLAEGEPLNPYPEILAIKDGSETTRVPVKQVQWVDAAGDYMCVHTTDGTHIMRKTMKELEQELDPRTFVRVHRSAIVNIRYVSKLVSHVSGEYHLVLSNGTELKVSRSHRDRVKSLIGR